MRSVLFFLPDARRVFRFPQPMTQLKLPAYLLIATLVCGGVFAWQSQSAYERMYDLVISEVPEAYVVMIREQTRDFAVVSAAILAVWVLAVAALCIGYSHQLIGPVVALRRQIQALKDGNYRARTKLRKSDTAFLEMGQDLDELAITLGNIPKS
jgi:protein-S-isoprenylcysteine O-methyltransferase Ste14